MDETLTKIANDALEQTGSASAVIFLVTSGGGLELAAAAGVEGAPLERLSDAVRSPDHPIARTAIGVLALAHQLPLTHEQRSAAMRLADQAGAG